MYTYVYMRAHTYIPMRYGLEVRSAELGNQAAALALVCLFVPLDSIQ